MSFGKSRSQSRPTEFELQYVFISIFTQPLLEFQPVILEEENGLALSRTYSSPFAIHMLERVNV
jgi:hypothetical protein